MEHVSNDHEDHPIQHENSHKWNGVSSFELDRKSIETKTTMLLEFPYEYWIIKPWTLVNLSFRESHDLNLSGLHPFW